MAPQYSFASSPAATATSKPQRRGMFGRYGRNRAQSEDNSDAGSLTYSAASSVQSAGSGSGSGSAAGESTDSSFADIMRVLDMQDTQQLKDFIAKEGVAKTDELYRKRGGSSSVMSVASSLQYSTDGESHLEGTKLLQTIGAGWVFPFFFLVFLAFLSFAFWYWNDVSLKKLEIFAGTKKIWIWLKPLVCSVDLLFFFL